MGSQTDEHPLVAHTKRELIRAGLFDSDSDYGGLLGNSVMELVETMVKQNHSGQSAEMVVTIFDAVIRHKNLTALTDDPSEWHEVSTETIGIEERLAGQRLWQNGRNPSVFSRDGGKTWYDAALDIEGKSKPFKEETNNAKPKNAPPAAQQSGTPKTAGTGTEAPDKVPTESVHESPAPPADEPKPEPGSLAGSERPMERREYPDRPRKRRTRSKREKGGKA